MKFTDYKHFMIVSTSTAILLQDSPCFTFSIPEPVEGAPYPNTNLHMYGTMIYDVPKTEDYPDGRMHVAIYTDVNLPFINPTGK